MSKDIAAKQTALRQAKRELVTLTDRTTKALTRERNRLTRELKRANARVKRTRVQLRKKADRLARSTKATVGRELKGQIGKLEKMLEAAQAEANTLRKDLVPVRKKLADARSHLSHALHLDKAMATLEKELAKALGKKPKGNKAATKKKAVTKKKKTTKKKMPSGKTVTNKRRTAKRKTPGARNKAA